MALRLSTGFRDKIMTPAADGGLSWADLLEDGVIKVFSGNQPSSSNDEELGTHLFTLTRQGGDEQTSGELTVGDMYLIVDYKEGDDFTNVGAPSNETGVVFKATETEATTYTNESVLRKDVGLVFGNATEGKITVNAGDAWRGTVLNSGIAGWFRFYNDDIETGEDATAIRLDGRVATSGGEMTLPVLSVTEGSTQTVDNFSITMPA